jgi:hypothetical protein
MGILTGWLTEWIKGLLVAGILSNFAGLFDRVNDQVGNIAITVGMTPWAFNPGVFNLIRALSETVVLPVAGLLLTFVMTWELIHLIIDRNNLHEVDTWLFFKWVFKTFIAVLLLSNTFNIVMGIFDVAQSVVSSAGGLIGGSTAVTVDMMATLEVELMLMDVGPLLGLWLQSFLIQIITVIMNIVIFVIVYGRMIEIYILTSLAPVPMATLTNQEMSSMGHNYLKSLLAIGFQGLLIMVCVAIYAVLIQSIAIGGDPVGAIWATIGYTALLCFTLFKTGGVAKSIFHAH